MKKCLIFFVFVLVCLTGQTFSQGTTPGRIISKIEADSLFGPVLQSVGIPSDSVQSWISLSDSTMMFNIENGQVVALSSGRVGVSNPGNTVDSATVYHLYGKLKVQELLLLNSDNPVVYFELRKDVFSITHGDSTLEFSTYCPPYCEQ